MTQVNKISSFKSFTELKNQEALMKLREENNIKRQETVNKIGQILDEMGLTSLSELEEDKKQALIGKMFGSVSEDRAEEIEDELKGLGKTKKLVEGNAFIYAAAKAKQEGKEEFEFNGKKYKVTLKKDTGLKESYQLLITEATDASKKRSDEFFNDSKAGETIKKLLGGKWDKNKVQNYLDKLGDGNDVKASRLLGFIAKNVGVDTNKFKTDNELETAVIDSIENLYKLQGKDSKKDTGLKESYQLLITEATRWQFGIIDKGGNIQSNYVHWDGHPSSVIPQIQGMNATKVKKILKDSEMGGMSSLNKYYNDSDESTTIKSNVKDIKKYLEEVENDASAEYVYLYDERDGKWYGANVYTDKKLKPVEQLQEALVNEALSSEQKMVATFVKKVAKEFDYSEQDAARFITDTLRTMGLNESLVNESFEDPLEGLPQQYKDLLKKLQRSNVPSVRSKLIDKMNVIRKGLKLKPLTNDYKESVNEAKIKSDVEFKEYAFTVLKKAFRDDFDEAKAQKVVDGILKQCDGDYGACVGMLTSSLG